MENTNDDHNLQGIIRRYSLMVAEESPDDPLSQALGTVARHDEAQARERRGQLIESQKPLSSLELAILRKQESRVVETQARFHARLALGAVGRASTRPPTIRELTAQVESDMKVWANKRESGYGKARTRIQNFLSVMNDHAYLFSVIPSGDKYTSLVTGVISSVVKASVNHKRIAERFSSYLAEIGEDLNSVEKSVQIANTPDMRRFVVQLYDKMFDFLTTAMEWYQSKRGRFKSALNQNYEEGLANKVHDIRIVLGRIQLEAAQMNQMTNKETNVQSKWIHARIAAKEMRDLADVADIKKKLAEVSSQLTTMGQEMKGTLQAAGQHTIHDQQERLRLENSKAQAIEYDGEADDPSQEDQDDSEVLYTYTRIDFEERASSSLLDTFLNDGRSEILKAAKSSKPMLPREVVLDIQKWIKIPSATVLWVEGPANPSFETQLSCAATRICDLALDKGIPCVSFFPKSKYELPGPGKEKERSTGTPARRQATLVALLYSVAGQLIRLLPSEFESRLRIDDVFASLDGSFASASTALDLIELLLEQAPSMLIAIDRLNLADHADTRAHLTRLLTLLRNQDGEKKVIKNLFTTAGSCVVLKETTKKGERVDAGRMVQGRPGQPLRGWAGLNDLKEWSSLNDSKSG
ncbi:hypothetical protein F5Y04DRAFT_124628 [Hypomontagnella monticulosa]|nr:hypothetical protein F5Y04DRAFT_124628 [Hypomontagnella monticulosa]